MKPGEFNLEISETHFRAAIADILDHNFVQRTFHPRPALIARKPVSGHRTWREYKGEVFDPKEFEKMDGYWDHEHLHVSNCRWPYLVGEHGGRKDSL